MRLLLQKLYLWLAAPLYSRLSRDIVLRTQTMMEEVVLFQEKTLNIIGKELVQMHLELQELEDLKKQFKTKQEFSNEQNTGLNRITNFAIATALSEINGGDSILTVSHRWQIPLADLLALERQYAGMDLPAINRARQLEQEIVYLRKKLSEQDYASEHSESMHQIN